MNINYNRMVAYVKVRYYNVGRYIGDQIAARKVIKEATAPQDFYIINNNKWQQFSELIITVVIPYDQEIEVNYRVVTATVPQCVFATQLKIDG